MPSARPDIERRGTWSVRRQAGTVAEIHAAEPVGGREVWLCEPRDRAVVVGSVQRLPTGVDPGGAPVVTADGDHRVVRRHSGGGAVLVSHDDVVWIDLVISTGDVLWRDDVSAAAQVIGDLWRNALVSLGVDVDVHRGALRSPRWSRQVCFAGLGPGEVVADDGAKLVGVSQRRTRGWARYQTAALLRWRPRPVVDVVLEAHERDEAELALGAVARGVGRSRAAIEDAFLAGLPA